MIRRPAKTIFDYAVKLNPNGCSDGALRAFRREHLVLRDAELGSRVCKVSRNLDFAGNVISKYRPVPYYELQYLIGDEYALEFKNCYKSEEV